MDEVTREGRGGPAFKGERPVPGQTPDDVFQGVIGRYLLANRILESAGAGCGLDVGCGTGIGSGFLASKGHKVLGLDVDRESLVWGSRQKFSPEFRLVQGRGEHLPFANETFDWVIAFESMEHMDSPHGFVMEAYRVLKPGGIFLCSVPHCLPDVLNEVLYGTSNRYHVQRFTPRTMEHLLSIVFEYREAWGQRFRSLGHYHRLLSRFLFWSVVLNTPLLRAIGASWRRWRDNPERHVPGNPDIEHQRDYSFWKDGDIPPEDRPNAYATAARGIPETTIHLAVKPSARQSLRAIG